MGAPSQTCERSAAPKLSVDLGRSAAAKSQGLNRNSARIPPAMYMKTNGRILPNPGKFSFYYSEAKADFSVFPRGIWSAIIGNRRAALWRTDRGAGATPTGRRRYGGRRRYSK